MTDKIIHNHMDDGVDRRGFLKCMAWAGTGVLWAMSGGILKSQTLSDAANSGIAKGAETVIPAGGIVMAILAFGDWPNGEAGPR